MREAERRERITQLLIEHEREGGSLAVLLAGSVGDAMDQLRQQPSQ